MVTRRTGGTRLAGVGRVNLLDPDTQPFGLVRDEGGELEERPGVLHPVVFAGDTLAHGPTACACRALGEMLGDPWTNTTQLF